MTLSKLVRRITHSRLASASMISSVLLVVAGTVAFASIPDSSGVINGCYKTQNGQLRVIDSSTQSCAKGEIALSWNQVGPQGLTGATGAAGPQGATGAPGPQGVTGATGATGAIGPNGATGAAGPKGDTGATGAVGSTGPAGAAGTDGAPGAPGTPGTNGANGTNGTNGTDGTSVSSTPLAVNDANCSNGGSAFTSANGTTYACNGAPGPAGPPGSGSLVSYYFQSVPTRLPYTGGELPAYAKCNAGDFATGGGYQFSPDGNLAISVIASIPSQTSVNGPVDSWQVVFNVGPLPPSGPGLLVTVFAVCSHQA